MFGPSTTIAECTGPDFHFEPLDMLGDYASLRYPESAALDPSKTRGPDKLALLVDIMLDIATGHYSTCVSTPVLDAKKCDVEIGGICASRLSGVSRNIGRRLIRSCVFIALVYPFYPRECVTVTLEDV